jgi:hypothetical protein
VTHTLFVRDNLESANYKIYLNYLKLDFALRFGKPQVEKCSTREECQARIRSLQVAESVKKAADAELMVHR